MICFWISGFGSVLISFNANILDGFPDALFVNTHFETLPPFPSPNLQSSMILLLFAKTFQSSGVNSSISFSSGSLAPGACLEGFES